MTLLINDEYFGETNIGTRDEFNEQLEKSGTFLCWYRNACAKTDEDCPDYDEWVEDALDKHLSEADAEEIAKYPRVK